MNQGSRGSEGMPSPEAPEELTRAHLEEALREASDADVRFHIRTALQMNEAITARTHPEPEADC